MTHSGLLRWSSAALALGAALALAPSCLNPRPEELPSSSELAPPGVSPPSGSPGTADNAGIGGDDLTQEPMSGGQPSIDGNPSEPAADPDPQLPDPMENGPRDAGATPGAVTGVPDAGLDGG